MGTAVNPATILLSGLSAALLLAAWLYPDYRYLSVVALAPLLVGLSRGRVNEGLALGFFFGVFFFAVRSLDALSCDLAVVLRQGLVGTFVLTIFSGLAAWSVRRYGLNALTVGVFWVFVEPALVALGLEGGLFRPLVDSAGLVHRLALTFGLSVVSTAVILFNLLLILAIDKVANRARVRPPDICVDERNWDLKSAAGLFAPKLFSTAESRGPPGILLTELPTALHLDYQRRRPRICEPNRGTFTMFKNFQILFALGLILVLAASPTFAQDKSAEISLEWPVFHTDNAGVAGQEPLVANGWIEATAGPINATGHHYFGIPNFYDSTVIKTLHLYLNGDIGVLDLAYVNAIGYDSFNVSVSAITLSRIRPTATGVLVEIVFDPQPHWETVELDFLNPVQITSATAWAHCQESYHPVPSLSTWGLIALIVLVLGAGIIMARRKATDPAV